MATWTRCHNFKSHTHTTKKVEQFQKHWFYTNLRKFCGVAFIIKLGHSSLFHGSFVAVMFPCGTWLIVKSTHITLATPTHIIALDWNSAKTLQNAIHYAKHQQLACHYASSITNSHFFSWKHVQKCTTKFGHA